MRSALLSTMAAASLSLAAGCAPMAMPEPDEGRAFLQPIARHVTVKRGAAMAQTQPILKPCQQI